MNELIHDGENLGKASPSNPFVVPASRHPPLSHDGHCECGKLLNGIRLLSLAADESHYFLSRPSHHPSSPAQFRPAVTGLTAWFRPMIQERAAPLKRANRRNLDCLNEQPHRIPRHQACPTHASRRCRGATRSSVGVLQTMLECPTAMQSRPLREGGEGVQSSQSADAK